MIIYLTYHRWSSNIDSYVLSFVDSNSSRGFTHIAGLEIQVDQSIVVQTTKGIRKFSTIAEYVQYMIQGGIITAPIPDPTSTYETIAPPYAAFAGYKYDY